MTAPSSSRSSTLLIRVMRPEIQCPSGTTSVPPPFLESRCIMVLMAGVILPSAAMSSVVSSISLRGNVGRLSFFIKKGASSTASITGGMASAPTSHLAGIDQVSFTSWAHTTTVASRAASPIVSRLILLNCFIDWFIISSTKITIFFKTTKIFKQ